MNRPLLATLAVGLVTFGLAPTSSAAFTSTSASAHSGVSASADWTPPSVSLRDPGAVLRGSVTVTADATDAETTVAEVVHQHRPLGASAWTDTCTVTAGGSVFACELATFSLADGLYELRAVATDAVGNAAASAVASARVDNRVPTVAIEDPGDLLFGTVPLDASASSPSGVRDVRIERAVSGTTSWVDVCVDEAAPFRCAWDTTTVADGHHDLRATLTDGDGVTTTSAVVTARQVDNAPLRGVDVQGAGGGDPGRIDAGDVLTVTYSHLLDLTTVIEGWSGAPRAVTIRLRDGAVLGGGSLDDTLDVLHDPAGEAGTPVPVGELNLGADLVKHGRIATLGGTLTAGTTVVDGREATTLHLRFDATPPNNVARSGGAGTMTWTPSTAVRDLRGLAPAAGPVVESGALDDDV